MTLIFYEKEYAQHLLKNGFSTFMSQRDLNLLARYFKSIGMNSSKIREGLLEFCKKYNTGFNELLYEVNIRRAVESCKKYHMREHMDIIITQEELNSIRTLSDYKQQKVLFVMLVIAKFFKLNPAAIEVREHDYYVNAKFAQIVKLAKVNVDKAERNSILYALNSSGLIETNLFGGYRITFVSEGDTAITITDMDNMVAFFPFFCSKCGKQMDKKLPRHDMCKECYKEKRKENVKINVKKHRNSM